MKTNITIGLASLMLLGSVGCANLTPTQKAARIERLSYAATSLGTQVALLQHPEYRAGFELALTNLDAVVQSKVISGAVLRQILLSLPIKDLSSPTARLLIENATLLYDILTGDMINLDNSPYVLAAATGIRDGIAVALTSTMRRPR